ncbi:hypothetical protein ANANG_G00187660 [Anguilla anguilla]|uniref:Small monomeric GTPase n=1 Tax=Anguilla anguilla TaxID=7936 RepID=A0A9D3RRN8_ANGAN|nr:hypothetical protein ANANG_G00187660 [Anguilla anguilla]
MEEKRSAGQGSRGPCQTAGCRAEACNYRQPLISMPTLAVFRCALQEGGEARRSRPPPSRSFPVLPMGGRATRLPALLIDPRYKKNKFKKKHILGPARKSGWTCGAGVRNANAYVLVYDICCVESFEYVKMIRQQIVEHRVGSSQEVPILVVGSKRDLQRQRFTPRRAVSALVKKTWKCGYVECSARYNWHVTLLFKELLGIAVARGLRQNHTSIRLQGRCSATAAASCDLSPPSPPLPYPLPLPSPPAPS